MFGADHFEASWDRVIIAAIRKDAGDCATAIEMIERELPALETRLGTEHSLIRRSKEILAECSRAAIRPE